QATRATTFCNTRRASLDPAHKGNLRPFMESPERRTGKAPRKGKTMGRLSDPDNTRGEEGLCSRRASSVCCWRFAGLSTNSTTVRENHPNDLLRTLQSNECRFAGATIPCLTAP